VQQGSCLRHTTASKTPRVLTKKQCPLGYLSAYSGLPSFFLLLRYSPPHRHRVFLTRIPRSPMRVSIQPNGGCRYRQIPLQTRNRLAQGAGSRKQQPQRRLLDTPPISQTETLRMSPQRRVAERSFHYLFASVPVLLTRNRRYSGVAHPCFHRGVLRT
jgi:hypothetical protein